MSVKDKGFVVVNCPTAHCECKNGILNSLWLSFRLRRIGKTLKTIGDMTLFVMQTFHKKDEKPLVMNFKTKSWDKSEVSYLSLISFSPVVIIASLNGKR
jgi:hypothetical protein